MYILVLCDDRWHPARTPRAGLAHLEAAGHHLEWVEDARDWSAEMMDAFPLVILTKSNNVLAADETPWMTPEVEQAFVGCVERGGGLLAIHSGTAGYAETPVLRALLGGVFVEHPPQCPVTVEPLAGHALTSGVEPFNLQDEHYVMALDDARAEVFLTTRSEHGEQPGGWTRSQGRGRVCVLTPGHNLPVWQHPSFQALLNNALHWCAGAAPGESSHA